MFDWTDLSNILDIGAKVFSSWSNFNTTNRQSDLDIATARQQAIFTQESAHLQAGFMRLQGDAAEEYGEYNAKIYDEQAGIALKTAARDKAIIADNAEIQRTLDIRSYKSFLSGQVASVAGAGIRLEGSAVDVMLDSAAMMDYTLATRKWATDVAIETRDIQGNLQNWEARVNAQHERFTGQMNKALKYKEADMTEKIGDLAASSIEQ